MTRLYSGVGMGVGALLGGVLYGGFGACSVFGLGLACVLVAAACLGRQQWAQWRRVEGRGYRGLQV